MLRSDELTAWNGFRAAAPRFAGEEIIKAGDGPDPPDVLATSVSGKTIGIEITKWVEHKQVTAGRGRELLENSYLNIIASENEPRPSRIGWVWLHDRSARVRTEDATEFRKQLFALLAREDAAPKPLADEWDGSPCAVPACYTPQGAPVTDFDGLQMLDNYLVDVWIFPRGRLQELPAGHPWVFFEAGGGPYAWEWMVQAAIDRILAKIRKYEHDDIRVRHSLDEFDLVCFYSDEALLHNSPIETVGFGFPQLAASVARALAGEPKVFDKIFLFHPYEKKPVVQIYSSSAAAAA